MATPIDTNKGKVTQPDKGASFDPWDTRNNAYDRTRHDWIVKNVLGKQNPFAKDQYGGWAVGDRNNYDRTLRSYNKGITRYDAYRAEMDNRMNQPPPGQTVPDPNAGRGPNDPYYGGGTPPPLFGGGGGGGGEDAPANPQELEAGQAQRWASAAQHSWSPPPPKPWAGAGQPAHGMRVHPNTQWSGSQTAKAINKWNEFQQKRAMQAGQVKAQPISNQQGRPTASRFNLGGNQMPTLRQQQWGQQGGNMNAALMQSNAPWQGPKG